MCLSQADQVKSTCTKEKEASVQFLYPQQFTYSQIRAENDEIAIVFGNNL